MEMLFAHVIGDRIEWASAKRHTWVVKLKRTMPLSFLFTLFPYPLFQTSLFSSLSLSFFSDSLTLSY